MFVLDGVVHWSASDLTLASQCEFALLSALDVKLHRSEPRPAVDDPLIEQIARLGDRHEEDALKEYESRLDNVAMIERVTSMTSESLQELQATTISTLESKPDLVFQAGFYDGEFHGYADFLERSDEGWIVCDAKLAREARPRALLQLGAYADQLTQAGIAVAPQALLLLGSGKTQSFPLAEILPVFRERRARLRGLLQEHQLEVGPVAWGVDRYVACGSCATCEAAAAEFQDLILVAGMRMDQRRRLRDAQIVTVTDLAAASECPSTMSEETFAKLQRQAAIQLPQLRAEAAGKPFTVTYELTDTARKTLALLPEPSAGDLFFDFEGDPLHHEGDLTKWGLEYLWGVMATPKPESEADVFTPLWAHDSQQEKQALIEFMTLVANQRAAHPDMHIYHYAPYETTALKRLVTRYQTHENELDDLLRSGVFVDLYATIRGSVRVSQPSYSIKKLEALYMSPDEGREGAVTSADVSIADYHEYRSFQARGESEKAEARLSDLEDYNRYDCLSTYRLREWLLERRAEAELTQDVPDDEPAPRKTVEDEPDTLEVDLLALAGDPDQDGRRTADSQALAMLAAALGYFRRERRPFWWEHFDRLSTLIDEWCEDRNVFRVSSHEVVSDWMKPPRAQKLRRTVRLLGDWGAGSTPSNTVGTVYEDPLPPGAEKPEDGLYGASLGQTIRIDETAPSVVDLDQSAKPEELHDAVPAALTPDQPPFATEIIARIRAMAEQVTEQGGLIDCAALDILRRRPPQLRDGSPLPRTGDTVADVVEALAGMDNSYVAIQGPPGTGKTWTGARVIAELEKTHRWRIGIVGQSHSVVENMLDGILGAGLGRGLVGKSHPRSDAPAWTVIPSTKVTENRRDFLIDNASSGCVLGGTAWTFASEKVAEAGELDLLVVDEAGQFALAPTIGSSLNARRLLLLGDPQQLPQVSQGTHPEPVDTSALGWLMNGSDTLDNEYGYFLGSSYRMHPTVCDAVSLLSYDGRLASAPQPSARNLDGVEPGVRTVLLEHRDNRTESPEEAAAVVEQVLGMLGKTWSDPGEATTPRPLVENDFLVVAPYNAQVNLIRRMLDHAGLKGVRVGTVDKFQGQEAPVAIVSMTASSHGDVPRGMGFLLSRNRINVAVSRAKWHAIILRSTALTSYMPSTTDELLSLGAFVGLCERATASSPS